MFKKKCKGCGTKVSKKFQFCPNCGVSINQNKNKEDYGMLGTTDFIEEQIQQPNSLLENLGSGILNKMLASSIKMLEKELQKEIKQENRTQNENIPKTNFQLYINGKKVNLGEFKSSQISQQPTKLAKTKLPTPSKQTLEASAKLPRKEPESKLQRIKNRIIYELDVPGIHELDQILVNKLENSIEIKAYAKDKVYTKTIPIKLALISYYLRQQKLFLEFQGK